MKKELIYNKEFNKAHVIEIYAKAIANLGPQNLLTEKTISFASKGNDSSNGFGGFSMSGYSSPLFAYIGSHLMQSKETASSCRMERTIPISEKGLRKIEMRNLEGRIKVIIEGNQRYVRKTENLFNELFSVDPEEYAQAKRIAEFLRH